MHGEPFFLVVAYNAPHFPMQAPQDDSSTATSPRARRSAPPHLRHDRGDGRRRSGGSTRRCTSSGWPTNTIVVFASDNGPYLGEVQGVSLDRFNYGWRGRQALRLRGRHPRAGDRPLAGRARRGPASSREMVHFTDWLPTLFSRGRHRIAGGVAFDGVDVRSVLAGDDQQRAAAALLAVQPLRAAGGGQRSDARRRLEARPARDPRVDAGHRGRPGDRPRTQLPPTRSASRSIDTSPLPEIEPGPPPAPLLFDLAADPFERDDRRCRVSRAGASDERSARPVVRVGRDRPGRRCRRRWTWLGRSTRREDTLHESA